MHNLFDGTFNGMSGSELYRAELAPDLFPDQRPMMLHNWPEDDLEMYVGGAFTPGYGKRAA
ncbi:hypothetical protein SEA_SWITZERLAND_58 [Gordonia phage Switzerland]|uniref:Uncharacterized protein n=1 Tax=Gordonia phage KatherineG TaxID=1838070 RepID=A0A160DGQ8_9CAUD|nr:hypothetical protein BEN62_gp051 [Gordonia phage KatherineG]ANA87192.1 hypothetical protein PBI_KATHERINEG_59 [Gordonia phage KatherineG]ASZ73935.1 hypothetical protein SEA_SHAYRA_59 [Gordonia phage ShayRa]QZD98706.1 hypothetical protein SEA_LOOPER_58 [Gordonia phage Looper]UOK18111.1 hypothetical protein SEA_SWITZERLAND_58 [Gordonia phage Switzerland]